MHVVEAFVDLGELAVVGDVLVDLDLALEVICQQVSAVALRTGAASYLRRVPGFPCDP